MHEGSPTHLPFRDPGNPVYDLVFRWRKAAQAGENRFARAKNLRAELYAAALDTIHRKAQLGISYNPAADYRFRWASQWLEVQEGVRSQINPQVNAFAAMLMDSPPELCGKQLAAGERPEP